MATRRDKSDERLDSTTMERVISLLEAEKPITKKAACEILNIAYNTTRLGTLIEKYKEKKARDAARKAALRGKPATHDEICYIITEYLEGAPIDSISETSYRGPTFVKRVLETNAVPLRASSHDYFKPELIPDGAVRERFAVGDTVYSARYDSMAKIEGEFFQKGMWVYRIWLQSEKQKQFAYQECCELASLEHLRKYGIKI